MPFIGQEPATGSYKILDAITTSATATYALTYEGVAFNPASERNLIVSLNGVTQAPGTAYTVTGSNITFASALDSADIIDYILVLGDVLSVGTPTDGTVGTAQLASTIDLSSKTVTFADNQISGNKVDGGTISNFTSTGIDDNASSTAITIDSDGDIAITSNGGGASNSADILLNERAKFGYDGSRSAAVISDQASNKSIVFDSNGSERMRIDTSGRLLVGKTATGLTTAGSEVTSGSILQSASSTSTNLATNNGGVINLCNISATDGNFSNIGGYNSNGLVVAQMNFINLSHSSRTGAITFTTHDGSSFNEKMRIGSSGNVQLGTSSGTYSESLLSAIRNGNSIEWGHTNTAGYGSTLGANVGSGAPFIGLSVGAGTNNNTFRTNGIAGSLITTDNAGALIFARVTTASADNQSSTESMRISSDGRLQFNTVGASDTNNSIFAHTNNYLYLEGGSSGLILADNAANSNRILIKDANTMEFQTNGSERMRIDSAGNVGIGTSSPTTGCKLHVADADAQIEIEGTGGSNSGFINFDGTNLQLSTNRNMKTGTFSNTGKSNASLLLLGSSGGSTIRFYTASADNTTASERLRVLSSGGITFNGDTAAANALDDYEEGTWTPSYGVSTGSFGSITYSLQTGYYTKVGNIVTAHGRLDSSSMSIGSASNYLFISGFPYASLSGAYQTGDVAYSYGYTSQWPTNISFQGSSYNAYMFAVDKSSNTGSVSPSNLGTGQTYLYFSITYMAA